MAPLPNEYHAQAGRQATGKQARGGGTYSGRARFTGPSNFARPTLSSRNPHYPRSPYALPQIPLQLRTPRSASSAHLPSTPACPTLCLTPTPPQRFPQRFPKDPPKDSPAIRTWTGPWWLLIGSAAAVGAQVWRTPHSCTRPCSSKGEHSLSDSSTTHKRGVDAGKGCPRWEQRY